MKTTIQKLGISGLLLFISSTAFSQSSDFLWAKGIGGQNDELGWSVATDASGNIYCTGMFRGTVDFDPGPGVYTLTGNGCFIFKLDSAGNFSWAKQFAGGYTHCTSIAVDHSGSVITTGSFYQ